MFFKKRAAVLYAASSGFAAPCTDKLVYWLRGSWYGHEGRFLVDKFAEPNYTEECFWAGIVGAEVVW
jgi:hypothetical protein